MQDAGWMLHDGGYQAVIWPFPSEQAAEAWRSEFCLPGFVVEHVERLQQWADGPESGGYAAPRRRITRDRAGPAAD